LDILEEVIEKQPRIKAIYGTGKISVDNIINKEIIKDFEVNIQKKKKILLSTSLLKLRLTTSLAY
jgi:ArsR family metal-binding transcriptional regulator